MTMTKAEVAKLLTLIAAFDRRTIGQTDVEAWHLVIGDLNPDDCAEAIRRHYTTNRDWLMPADVRTGAITAARQREGRARLARLEAQIAAENPPLELHDRAVQPLTVGQTVPPARLLAQAVTSRKPATAVDTEVVARQQAARAQARAELEQARRATPGSATPCDPTNSSGTP